MLLLLSCYAPATPIPWDLLQSQPLADLFVAGHLLPTGTGEDTDAERQRWLRSSLHDLAMVGLINIASRDDYPGAQAVTVHPVVADANRARLRTTALPALPGIGEAAVRLVCAASTGLDHRRPADWSAWGRLVPHILALLEWLVAHVTAATLADLVSVSNRAAIALVRGGNHAAAEKLADAAVTAGTRLGGDHPRSSYCPACPRRCD